MQQSNRYHVDVVLRLPSKYDVRQRCKYSKRIAYRPLRLTQAMFRDGVPAYQECVKLT